MKVVLGKYKKKKDRKIKIRIDPWDTWSMDHTLALIIIPLLKQLKDTSHGYPADLVRVGGEEYEDQRSFDFYTETLKEYKNYGADCWTDILNKMIWSFEQIANDTWEDLFFKGLGKNMVFDRHGYEEYTRRIEEGLELFGKYYRALWD